MKYKCAIFDLDGTLLDSLQGILDALNQAFEQCGLNIIKGYDKAKDFIGGGATVFAERAMKGENISENQKDKILQQFMEKYGETQLVSAKAYPGISDFLKNLKKHGYLICIASNKPQKLLEPIVDYVFPDIEFDLALGHEKGAPVKPDPYIINKIFKKLNLSQKDCIYVGDSEYDIDTAINSGLDSIIVKYGYGFYEQDWIKKATYVVDKISELEKLLLE